MSKKSCLSELFATRLLLRHPEVLLLSQNDSWTRRSYRKSIRLSLVEAFAWLFDFNIIKIIDISPSYHNSTETTLREVTCAIINVFNDLTELRKCKMVFLNLWSML